MSTATLTGFGLSPQQQRLWRLHGSGCAPGFVVQGSVELLGPLDRDRLWSALTRVVERHEVLRTTFRVLPGMLLPVQVVEEAGRIERSEHRLKDARGLEALQAEARSAPFDLAAGPLLRAALAELGEPGRHHLLLTLPSLAADAASIGVLVAEIAAAYAGEDEGEPPFQYVDAAEIFQEWLGPVEGEEGASYWRRQDLSALSRPGLRHGEALPAVPFAPRTATARLDSGGAGALLRLAEQTGISPVVVALAGWAAALWQTTGEEEVVIGTGFDGRTCAEFETALGPYARCLPVRCRLGPGSTLAGITAVLQTGMAEAASRQDFFPPDVVDEALGHGPAGWPFGFDYAPASRFRPVAGGSLVFQPRAVHAGLDRFDLRLLVHEEGDGSLRFDLDYDPAVREAVAAERLLARAVRGIAALSAEPHREIADFDVLSEEERHELLIRFNETAGGSEGPRTARELLAEPARRSPDAPAVASGGLVLSHAELRERVLRLAGHLADLGVGRESRVGVCLERSPGSTRILQALLAVLEAGGAYVPLDPGYPAERLSFLLDDSEAAVLLTEERLLPRLPSPIRARVLCLDRLEDEALAAPPDFAAPPLDPENLAYVIYTSGSTGRPKGVMIPHRGLASYLLWAMEAYRAREGSGAPVHSAVGFDLTVTSLFVPLAAGRPVELLPEEQGVGALAAVLREGRGFSLVKLTPAHLEVLRHVLTSEEAGGCAGALVIGGETLRAESLALFREGAPGTRLINEYGPTEATVGCCVYEVGPEDPATGAVPIGRPITGTRLYVVGPGLRPVPAGAPGELWIGGQGLARGYLGRPALTAERFVPDPFGPPGGRLYRTGDRVRLRPDGNLEFLGRLDDQVKIRGHRIELGEVEAALAAHEAVGEVAVVTRGEDSERALVAYFVPRGQAAPVSDELRAFLGRRLPEPMVPSAFVALEALPLTAHGKVDRRALPEPREDDLREAPYSPPRNLTEEVLAEIFARVLGVERVGIDDSFFALGGDSIRSVQVVPLAQKRGIALTVQDLFNRPTIRGLAGSARIAGTAPEPEPDPAPFALISPADAQRLAPGVEDAYPVSQLQAGMLFHTERDPESAVYHVQHSYRLKGRFDLGLMQRAIERIVERHPILRTSFDLTSFSEPLQIVHAHVAAPLSVDDLRALEPEAQRETVLAWLAASRHRPFDWTRPPLIQFHVHLLGEDEFQITLSLHHAVLDGWSVAVMLSELFRVYGSFLEGSAPPEEPPLATSFRELLSLEQSLLGSEEAIGFWHRYLEGIEPTPLPRRGAGHAGARGAAVVEVPLSSDLSQGLHRLARAAVVPLKSILLAAHLRVLSRLSGRTDVSSGLVSHARPERQDGERVLGMFLNTLPLRLRLGGGTWLELAQAGFDVERSLLPYRAFPLPELQRLQGGRPLFEVLFNFLHFHAYRSATGGPGLKPQSAVDYEEVNYPFMATFLLSLSRASSHVMLYLNYHLAEFGAGEVEEIGRRYRTALEAMVADPNAPYEETDLLSPAERSQVLAGWNDTRRDYDLDRGLHELVEAQVERTPDALAVELDGAAWTYRELDARAEALARELLRRGSRPEEVVALHGERSLGLLAGLLGILKAGAAWLPLDPALPPERRVSLRCGSGARFVVVHGGAAGVLPPGEGEEIDLDALPPARLPDGERQAAGRAARGDRAAYVLYTSGSTGEPKGAVNSHRAIVNRLLWMQEAFGLGPEDRVLQKTPTGFDVSVWELFWPLLTGARLVLARPGGHQDPAYLARRIATAGITTVHFVPSMLRAFLEEPQAPACASSLRRVICSGEALTMELRQRCQALLPVPLFNLYGPTEAAVDVSVQACGPGVELEDLWTVPIGRPIANTALYLLDGRMDPVPPGSPGELYIGGVQPARGYLGRPDLTAERFVPDPFPAAPGARLYRTGDLARHRPGGEIEYLGRTDHQVKVRGQRIELGEIEAVLETHPEVREAAVVARSTGSGDLRLLAYLVPREEETAEGMLIEKLRAFAGERLPEAMVPSGWAILERLPLTASGKVDRKALPDVETALPQAGAVAPRTPVEEVLAGIFADVLGQPRAGVRDSFFELGGHSLLATRVMSRVRAAFEVDLPLRALFDAPTVAGLAAALEEIQRAGAAPVPPLVPVPREGDPPLSFAQQRLWFLDQLLPGDLSYSLPAALLLSGALDPAALAKSFGELVARHETLRTTFAVRDGEPVQRIAPPAGFPVPVADLAGLPPDRAEAEVRRLAAAEARRPFDLARGPLLRVSLVRLGDREHALLLNLHHIVTDAWSMGVLIRELAALYAAAVAGAKTVLPELPVQYADYAVWQRDWLRGEALETQLAWWRRELAGAPAALDLPLDRPRPAVSGHRGGQVGLALSAELTAALGALARRRGATLFMTLLAGWSALLSRYTAQEDVLAGSPIANRNRLETEGLIGFFVNTLVLRTDLSGSPGFDELVARVRRAALGAYDHQDLPFERLVEELAPERSLGRSPLFQVMFELQHAPAGKIETAGLELRPMELERGTAKFDLTLWLTEASNGLHASLEFNSDLFDLATAERLLGRFATLLGAAVSEPTQRVRELPLLSEPERHQVLIAGNGAPAPEGPVRRVHEWIAVHASEHPGAPAVRSRDAVLSYGELADRAGRLAARLQSRGAGPGTLVGLCLDRSPELIVGLLGILGSGAAYVPFDPSYPVERLAFVLADTGVPLLVTRRGLVASLPLEGVEPLCLDEPEDAPVAPIPPVVPPEESPAYVIYTSGSTGRPKGVVVAHRSLANYTGDAARDYGLEPADRVLQFASVSFDASAEEIYPSLVAGSTLVLRPEGPISPAELLALCREQRITVLNLPTAWWHTLVADLESGSLPWPETVRLVILGGEEALPEAVRAWQARIGRGVRLVNTYGPTEGTIVATRWDVPAEPLPGRVPIGRPVGNVRTYVLDAGPDLLPPGIPGELCLAGAGLAHGYLGRPDVTADRFRPDPFATEPGERLYRTGDLARWRDDGQLEFLGRVDRQVKIRGHRVELLEVEAALCRHPSVAQASVAVWGTPPEDRRLAAWVVPPEGAVPDPAELRTHLRALLPEPMVPSAWTVLPALPLTPSGKVDRASLPPPDRPAAATAGFEEPQTVAEREIAGIWRDLLGVERVGLHDNFFDLGGHSLLMVRVQSRLRSHVGREVSMVDLFSHPTVTSLARLLTDAPAADPAPLRSRDQEERIAGSKERLRRLRQGSSSERKTR